MKSGKKIGFFLPIWQWGNLLVEKKLHSIFKQKDAKSGAQPEIFQGRGGLLGLGHFYKLFVKNTRKKGPAGKNLGAVSPRYP